jgi:thiamine-phosphate pyrophosphorylase
MITPPVAPAGVDALVSRIEESARAGVDLVQIRQPQLEAAVLTDLARRSAEVVRRTRTRLLVNDRLDVALAAGAHGVHLREQSMSAARVRGVVPREFLLGRSVHDLEAASRASAAGGLDYLIFGTIFPTSSKPGQAAAGDAALADVVASAALPVLAIGGMTLERLRTVARTGAAGFAAIGLFADGDLADIVGEATRRWADSNEPP